MSVETSMQAVGPASGVNRIGAAGSAAGAAGSAAAAAGTRRDASVPPVPAAAEDPDTAVRAAARQIDSYLKSVGREVEFRVDEDTGMTVVTVRETTTGEVIRQIPNEDVLQLARRLTAGPGSLLDLSA